MQAGDIEEAGKNILHEWIETFNTDKPKVTELYAEDASLHGTSSPELFVGREVIRSYFTGRGEVAVESMKSDRLAADTALLTGHYVFYDQVDGSRKPKRARYTFIVRDRAGKCEILHHHSSADPR